MGSSFRGMVFPGSGLCFVPGSFRGSGGEGLLCFEVVLVFVAFPFFGGEGFKLQGMERFIVEFIAECVHDGLVLLDEHHPFEGGADDQGRVVRTIRRGDVNRCIGDNLLNLIGDHFLHNA